MGSFELAEWLEDCELIIVFLSFCFSFGSDAPFVSIILPGVWACA